MGLKEELLALADRAAEEVEVPEWGRSVRLMAMTAADRDTFEAASYLARKDGGVAAVARNMRARLLVRSIVDESGARVFGDDDVEALGQKGAKALDRLYGVATRLNALSEGEVKAIEGNSEPGPRAA